ncbi:MAG: hypothetical protein V5A64_04560 [Candidatus Thermoplasmatota archaeon]
MLKADVKSKINGLIHSWFFWVLVVTGVAIFIRMFPAWTNAGWGCDFGIYLGLSEKFVATGGQWYNPYTGWGSSYNYFPVLYAITGFAHWITGLEVSVIMPKIGPIFGGLTVFIFYFLVKRLVDDKRVAFLSCLFLAVLPFHVYQTSHTYPLTIGHFFMMLSLLLFVRFRKNFLYLVPLFISSTLLVMSHHLTTYFYLITLFFVIVFENGSSSYWRRWFKRDILYFLSFSVIVFSYWFFVATPVFNSFMNNGLNIGGAQLDSFGTIAAFYCLFFVSLGLCLFLRKFNNKISSLKEKGVAWAKLVWRLNPFVKKPYSSLKRRVLLFSVTLILIFSAMIFFVIFEMPWLNFSFTWLSVLYSFPLLVVVSFGLAGFRDTLHVKNGMFIRGWILAVVLSLFFTLATNNQTLFPHRHIEYLMAPLSIVTVFGLQGIFLKIDYQGFSKKVKKVFSFSVFDKSRILKKRQMVLGFVVLLLVVSNAISVYPSHVALKQSYEAITPEDVSAVEWIKENLNRNHTVVASDHRLERMVESEGFNTTKDKAIKVWLYENLSNYSNELFGVGKNYSRITHVLIDDIMKDQVLRTGLRTEVINLTDENYEKFSNPVFEQVYRSESVETIEEDRPLHWAEVYRVNWSYILKSDRVFSK